MALMSDLSNSAYVEDGFLDTLVQHNQVQLASKIVTGAMYAVELKIYKTNNDRTETIEAFLEELRNMLNAIYRTSDMNDKILPYIHKILDLRDQFTDLADELANSKKMLEDNTNAR